MRSSSLFACATALAAVLAAGQASAQTYNRLVVFGDSLSDSGNLFRATGGTTPPSPPYFQGRYSNGPTFVELLGFGSLQLFGATTGNVNNAFAGAETGLGAFPPGLRTQLNGYQAAGGTFGPNTLVSVLGGGNDLANALASSGASADPVGAISVRAGIAAANIGALVTQLGTAGAGTVIVTNLPSLGSTPLLRSGPAAQLADVGAQTFNALLAGQLNAVAASGATTNTNVILVDVFRLDAYVRANPGQFGLSDVTNPCLNPTTGAICSNPDSFYYWDPFHPTASTQRAFAATVLDYAYYGTRGAATATQGEASLDHREGAFEAALDRLDATIEGSPDVTLQIDYEEANEDARGEVPDSDRSTVSARLGFSQKFTPTMAGGVLLSVSDSEVEAGPLSFQARSLSADGFVGWTSGAVFVNGVAGIAVDEYDDIRRATGLGPVEHSAPQVSGSSYGGKLQAGWRGQFGAATLSPRVAVSATHVDVDTYNETGPVARHAVRARDLDAVGAEAALRLETPLSDRLNGHVEGGYGDFLSYDGDIATALADNPANPIAVAVEEPGRGFKLKAGLEGQVFGDWNLGLGYRGRFDDGADAHMALLSLTLKQ